MYAIRKHKDQQQPKRCRPNILPCRINHTGPANASRRYWSPTTSQDGQMTISHFRGRKLHGRTLTLPKGYRGVALVATEQKLPRDTHAAEGGGGGENEEEEVDGDEQVEDTGVLEERAEFDEMVVWGHEALLDGTTDPYVRGVEEWIDFAEQIHSYPSEGREDQTKLEKA